MSDRVQGLQRCVFVAASLRPAGRGTDETSFMDPRSRSLGEPASLEALAAIAAVTLRVDGVRNAAVDLVDGRRGPDPLAGARRRPGARRGWPREARARARRPAGAAGSARSDRAPRTCRQADPSARADEEIRFPRAWRTSCYLRHEALEVSLCASVWSPPLPLSSRSSLARSPAASPTMTTRRRRRSSKSNAPSQRSRPTQLGASTATSSSPAGRRRPSPRPSPRPTSGRRPASSNRPSGLEGS
jgi:hypothetical protein